MKNSWRKTLIKEDATLVDALQVIDSEALRVALVVDDDHCLLGVITDGDIRRAILQNMPLSTVVAEVMSRSPITAQECATKSQLSELMKSADVLAIPILRGQRVVGLEVFTPSPEQRKYKNPVFIMAGGFGTRLRPLTDSCPKPMLEIDGIPMLERVIQSFIKAGYEYFYISTHYMPELIQQHFGDGSRLSVTIQYVHESAPLGTGGALGLLPTDLPDDLPVIMMNGDILTNIDFTRLLEFHNQNSADATMCVREYDYQIPYGVITGNGNKVTGMVEKPTHRFFVNAGIYVLSPNLIRSVSRNEKIDMPTLLERRIAEHRTVLMFPVHEYWLDIGRMDDFKRAQTDVKRYGL